MPREKRLDCVDIPCDLGRQLSATCCDVGFHVSLSNAQVKTRCNGDSLRADKYIIG